jgi:hypothetical protein
VFFSVSGYAGALATGAIDPYGYNHNIIVLLCVPVVITSPSYFVEHLPCPGEGKAMETAAKKIEELEKSFGGVRGQRRRRGTWGIKPQTYRQAPLPHCCAGGLSGLTGGFSAMAGASYC